MATVVTKNFRIKTGENSFSDPINFLSTSVYLPSGKDLDTHLEETKVVIDTEIQDRKKAISDEQAARQDADTELGNRINTLNTNLTNSINSTTSTLTGLINTETQTRESADQTINGKIQTLTENLNGEITQRENSISTLQTTVEENTNNINSLKGFLVGENQIEENASPLADQVQNNLSSIQSLQNLIGASSLEEGVLSLLERIVILENEVASLKGEDVTEEISFLIDSVQYFTSKDNTWLNYATENGWNCSGEESRISLPTDSTLEMYDTIERRFVQGQDLIQDKRDYTWADEGSM